MDRPDELDGLLTRLLDAFDDRAAEVFDERARDLAAGSRPSGVALPLGSLALGVAATAVTGGGLVSVVVIWLSIAVVNIAWAWRH